MNRNFIAGGNLFFVCFIFFFCFSSTSKLFLALQCTTNQSIYLCVIIFIWLDLSKDFNRARLV